MQTMEALLLREEVVVVLVIAALALVLVVLVELVEDRVTRGREIMVVVEPVVEPVVVVVGEITEQVLQGRLVLVELVGWAAAVLVEIPVVVEVEE